MLRKKCERQSTSQRVAQASKIKGKATDSRRQQHQHAGHPRHTCDAHMQASARHGQHTGRNAETAVQQQTRTQEESRSCAQCKAVADYANTTAPASLETVKTAKRDGGCHTGGSTHKHMDVVMSLAEPGKDQEPSPCRPNGLHLSTPARPTLQKRPTHC